MVPRILLAGVLLTAWTCLAHASGLNLAWDDCGAAGATLRSFACDTNDGRQVLIGSAEPPQPLERFVGADIVLQVCVEGATLAPWWQLNLTGCRGGALTMNADFSGTPSAGTACADIFQGQGGGGIGAYLVGYGGRNLARIAAFWAMPFERRLDTVETYLFRLVFDQRRTVGADACDGCAAHGVVIFEYVLLAQPAGVGDVYLNHAKMSQWAMWQQTPYQCFWSPVRRVGWGLIKSLYR